MRIITALTAAAIGLTGCERIEYGCTDIMMWSIELSLEDEAGTPVADAVVSVTNGSVTEDCSTGSDGIYYCGGEMAGELTISMQASGFGSEELDVTVEADECHVIPESLTHTMMAVDCTTEAVTSVVVHVTDEAGSPLPQALVSYVPVNDDIGADNIDCMASGDGFYCGEEVAGEMEISAWAEGFEAQYEVVTVGVSEDGCHVITQELDIALIAE